MKPLHARIKSNQRAKHKVESKNARASINFEKAIITKVKLACGGRKSGLTAKSICGNEVPK